MWFDDGRCLAIHLGMTGQLYWTSLEGRADRHSHLRLEFEQSDQVLHFRDVRRFGRLKLYRSKADLLAEAAIAKLGPEPLQIGLGEFRKLLQRHRMIKALLLDQAVIVGFGNIYTDEVLFAARIHPAYPAESLSPLAVARLYRAMKRIFKRAIAAGGSTIRDFRGSDGRVGRFQTSLKVYQRTGKNCPRCRTKIQRLIIAGRSTHICPTCQPLDS
jgi:formamidopyrimidine-DNA glycosylase